MATKPNTIEDFWKKTDRTGDCWLWLGTVDRRNRVGDYPLFKMGGVIRPAWIIAWEVVNGPIPPGFLGDRRCENSLCVNPAHRVIASEVDYFWSKAADGRTIVPDLGPCREWTGTINVYGYGKSFKNGKIVGAHRRAWELTFGAIPDGLCVCHKCDNPPCVNPKHLFLGTKRDNYRDMMTKGRYGSCVALGSKHTGSKLHETDIPKIRSMAASGVTQQKIADHFGITNSRVCHILQGKAWKHVP